MAFPVIVVKQEGRRPLYVQVREPIEVGRECDGLLLADLQASRRHATLSPQGPDVLVEDLGSTNGTYVDGTRISSAAVVGAGTVLQIGNSVLQIADDVPVTARPADSGIRGETIIGAPGSADALGGPVRAAAGEATALRETSIDAVAREVSEIRPPLTDVDSDHGTITIVFSDIESSTERATAMGDAAWMKVLSAHNDIIQKHVKTWKGTVVKNQGDGFMLTFDGARRALRAMVGVQEELAQFARSRPEQGVRVRVGVHTGEVIAEQGDIFGKHVMFAARVGGLADGGEILVSSIVKEITSARGDLEFGEPRVVSLKGIEGEHVVYPLLWKQSAPVD